MFFIHGKHLLIRECVLNALVLVTKISLVIAILLKPSIDFLYVETDCPTKADDRDSIGFDQFV